MVIELFTKEDVDWLVGANIATQLVAHRNVNAYTVSNGNTSEAVWSAASVKNAVQLSARNLVTSATLGNSRANASSSASAKNASLFHVQNIVRSEHSRNTRSTAESTVPANVVNQPSARLAVRSERKRSTSLNVSRNANVNLALPFDVNARKFAIMVTRESSNMDVKFVAVAKNADLLDAQKDAILVRKGCIVMVA